jgi:hypothetical protein
VPIACVHLVPNTQRAESRCASSQRHVPNWLLLSRYCEPAPSYGCERRRGGTFSMRAIECSQHCDSPPSSKCHTGSQWGGIPQFHAIGAGSVRARVYVILLIVRNPAVRL